MEAIWLFTLTTPMLQLKFLSGGNTWLGGGGGLSVYYDSNLLSFLLIINSTFANNEARRDGGGGVYVFPQQSAGINLDVIESSFYGNTAYQIGSALCFDSLPNRYYEANLTISKCTFTNNSHQE